MAEHGSLEVFFSFVPVVGRTIVLTTDIQALPAYYTTGDAAAALKVSVEAETIDGDRYVKFKTLMGADTVDVSNFQLGEDAALDFEIRIFIYDQYISGYCNGCCVYSYAVGAATYLATVTASLSVTVGTLVLGNICRSELADQREAVYVDYEANTESAIQSVIQQRPIEINAGVDRNLEFTYSAVKDTVLAHHIKQYADTLEDNLQLSSDGIIQGEDVALAIDAATAEEVGLITRLYRLSELSSGAIEAARKYQITALQKRHEKTVDARLDPRLEARDILAVDLIATSTLRHIEDNIIVEGIQIRLEDGAYRMSVSGRKKT
jgi:hypothetical protein